MYSYGGPVPGTGQDAGGGYLPAGGPSYLPQQPLPSMPAALPPNMHHMQQLSPHSKRRRSENYSVIRYHNLTGNVQYSLLLRIVKLPTYRCRKMSQEYFRIQIRLYFKRFKVYLFQLIFIYAYRLLKNAVLQLVIISILLPP